MLSAWRKLNQTPLYTLLYTYVVFGANLFYMLAIASVFVLRVRQPDAHRPYKTWGYPVTPFVYVLAVALFSETCSFDPSPGRVIAASASSSRGWSGTRCFRGHMILK